MTQTFCVLLVVSKCFNIHFELTGEPQGTIEDIWK